MRGVALHCVFLLQDVRFSYKVKIYDPAKRTKFSVRHMHNVRKKFESVAALRCALWDEFEDVVPEEGEFILNGGNTQRSGCLPPKIWR